MTSSSATHIPLIQDAVRAFAADPDARPLDHIIGDLRQLAGEARNLSQSSQEFQRMLYWLHYGEHEPSYALRQWLASLVYDYFEATAELIAVETAQSPDALRKLLHDAQNSLSPLVHPLFVRIYADSPRKEFEIYLRHKWIIMLTFWRSLAEYAGRLQRLDLHNTALVYKNVHEELGEGDASKAHLTSHYGLLRHLGINVSWDDVPEFAETYEYINFRMFCMRHEDLSWGAGSFFSQEATSLEYTMGHYRRLRAFGIEHDKCAIYHEHDEIDTEHTAEIESIIIDLAISARQQATVLRAQRHQMHLWNAHFDRVLEEIEQL